jgi:hypothetical protein
MAQAPLYGQALRNYIIGRANALGLDARAVIADVMGEGGFQGAVGDVSLGGSYGPFQLFRGGAGAAAISRGYTTPSGLKTWANTPAGIDYALRGIAAVAKGQTGATAIHNIVYKFEKPANPSAEVTRDIGYYSSLNNIPSNAKPTGKAPGGAAWVQNKGIWGYWGKAGGKVGKKVFIPYSAYLSQQTVASEQLPGVATAKSAISSAESVAKFLGKLGEASTWIRIAKIIGGGVLVSYGVVLLAKQGGTTVSVPSPVKAIGSIVPETQEDIRAVTETGYSKVTSRRQFGRKKEGVEQVYIRPRQPQTHIHRQGPPVEPKPKRKRTWWESTPQGEVYHAE